MSADDVKIDDRGWRDVKKLLAVVRASPYVDTGVFEGSGEYADGTPVAEIAAIHEYGTRDGRIEPRSFVRAGLEKADAELTRLQENLVHDYLAKRLSWGDLQKRLGEAGVKAIQDRITSGGVTPKLAPSTIARKGHDIPLYDTGTLVNAVSWRPGK